MKKHNVASVLLISMKLSKLARLLTRLPLRAVLFVMAMSMLSVPAAYSQQEVDPTWFNPWTEPSKVISQPSQPRAAKGKPQRKTNSVLSERRPPKSHRKLRLQKGSS